MTSSSKLLIIEDESAIRDMICFALSPAGFDMIEAGSIIEAEKKLISHRPDLILLDWMLPGMSGMDFAKKLKKNPLTHDIPIIMLTARAEEENKIKGLDIGADDYITKPFSPRELIARIKTVLRRSPLISVDNTIQVNRLTLDPTTQQVYIDQQKIFLSPIEYKLLYFFMTHPERIYSRNQLLDYVWQQQDIDERTVDVHIRRLRQRLHYCDCYIKTLRGSGYQFSGKNGK